MWLPCFRYPRVPSRDTQNPSDLGIPSQMRVDIAKQCVELGLPEGIFASRHFVPTQGN